MSTAEHVFEMDGGDPFGPTQAARERARHAPGFIYTSPEILAREKQRIFLKDWLYAGRAEEYERPGDFKSFRVLGEPVAISRDSEGLNAFANVCAHRGVEVVPGEGNTQVFSCPYHAWSYDLKGQLLGAPLTEDVESFDFKSCRMAPVRLATWAGNVFVCLDPDTPPFEEAAASFIEQFAFLRMEDCGMSGKMTIDLDCNWKLVVENLMDMYHVGTLHVRSFGQYTTADPARFKLLPGGGMRFDYSSAPATPSGKTFFGKIPWLADQPDSFAVTGFLPPNMQIFVRSDQIRILITWPLAPDRSRIVYHSLFPKEHFELRDFNVKVRVYHDYIASVLDEDRSMVQSLQNAMSTRAFQPGPMAGLEKAVHHALTNYLDRIR
ncbi:MAG: aromatic ring-hydroxylating dioxygenase subunit alpha [Candidatus Rokubacteria bacterium]|nr:aromatic ring-hydroxylating dioxygenase subunit alpha [Candidatus Rokubacteria bacterium]